MGNMAPEEDMTRRDFTANAIAWHTDTGEFVDPLNGREDILNKTLRMTRPQAFEEDPLRSVRAVIAFARHGLMPDQKTLAALRENAHRIRSLPGERIYEEVNKLMNVKQPAHALSLAHSAGILRYLFPEVDKCFGVDQLNPHHDLDVGHHIMKVFEHACDITVNPDVRMAALFHDIGKPDSKWVDEKGIGHFYYHPKYPESANHDELGASMAEQALERMRFPKERIREITKLVRLHMFPTFKSIKGARKFLANAGDLATAEKLLDLRQADHSGKGKGLSANELSEIDLMRDLVRQAVKENHPTNLKQLAVNGSDIVEMGIKGPEVGRVLKELMDIVIDNPDRNNRDDLLGMIPNIANG